MTREERGRDGEDGKRDSEETSDTGKEAFDEIEGELQEERRTVFGEQESTTESDEEITPQPEALRQQQYVVGVGVAVLAGFALAIGSFQRFPELPTVVPAVFGLLGAALVYWIVKRSLYPTEKQLAVDS